MRTTEELLLIINNCRNGKAEPSEEVWDELAAICEKQTRDNPKPLTMELLTELSMRLAKEKEIISHEGGKDYAHLTFKDGREHTLMRVNSWISIKLKQAYDYPPKGCFVDADKTSKENAL